ncbi:FtsB family cell division protein [Kytococcus schroeteri]|uniref:FtsB family cell division protein n=1 Tax=Kytococcus schroeteri TaxID=138300 RepID=UPI00114319A3|nr:septum formation initiator family protein [Kytococcus schroeteri]
MAPGHPRTPRRAPGSARRGAQVALVGATPWRGVALLVTVLLAAWIAVPPFAGWWTQRAEIRQTLQESAQEQDRTRELVAQRDELRDDEHLRQLARTRLDYAEPGEKRYHVLTDGEVAQAGHDAGTGGKAAWYEQVWGSVEQSAQGVSVEPQPAEEPAPEPGSPAPSDPVREVEQPVPDGVPSLITEDGFDPADIPASDLQGGEEKPAAEGAQ